MHRSILAAVFALLALAACGGGGEAPPPPAPTIHDLGLVPGNVQTTSAIQVTNNTGQDATVTDISEAGPFSLFVEALPFTVAPGETADVPVVFDPPGLGEHQQLVTAQVVTSNGTFTVTGDFRCEVEAPSMAVQTLNVAFGDVLIGASADRTATVANTSTVTSLDVNGVLPPDAAFTMSNATPLRIPPGETRDVTLRYTPTRPGNFDTTLELVMETGRTPIGITATTGGQEIIDLGTQTFDEDGNTPEFSFDVPADAIAFTIEGRTNDNTATGLRLLMGPGDREYENEQLTGAYLWRINAGFHLSQVPNTDRPEVQLVDGGGTYRCKLFRWQGTDPDVDVRVIIERRPGAGTETIGTLDLNVFLANGIAPTAATAASDNALQTVLTAIDSILSQQGLRLGDIDYYDVTNPAYDFVTTAEFGPMLATSSIATETRLNLFFVNEALGNGVLGVAATLGGPAVNGTQLSGVMSLYNTANPGFIGLVAAHEIGHFVGLAHTVERAGTHDDILDTAECPPSGTDSNCAQQGGGYLMHWAAVGGTTITDGQGLVIRGHPLISPRAAPPATTLTGVSSKPVMPMIHVDPTIPQDWCGTCRNQGLKGK